MTNYSGGFILGAQPNFRDIGGLVTKTGETVKCGLIYRSGDLSALTSEDISLLEKLEIRTVADFRSDREVEKRPDKPVGTVVQTLRFPIEDAIRETAMQLFNDRNAGGLRDLLAGDYRRMIREGRTVFRDFFAAVQSGDTLPMVFHCAAGKDRTGLASWFLLTALGVPEKVIREDYLSTNRYCKTFADKIVARTNEKGLRGEIIRPLLEVRDEYIDAALEEVDERFGGMEIYLEKELKADVNALRRLLLIHPA